MTTPTPPETTMPEFDRDLAADLAMCEEAAMPLRLEFLKFFKEFDVIDSKDNRILTDVSEDTGTLVVESANALPAYIRELQSTRDKLRASEEEQDRLRGKVERMERWRDEADDSARMPPLSPIRQGGSMNVLFLDDSLQRSQAFRSHVPSATQVFDAEWCIEALKAQPWDVVLLDHDLGGEENVDSSGANTGMEVVRWIESNKPKVKTFIVHSCNEAARIRMASRLELAGYATFCKPWIIGVENIVGFIEALQQADEKEAGV